MNRNTTSIFLIVAFGVLLGTASRASAHDLKAALSFEGDPLKFEAWFDDDTPAQGARVVVTRSTGEEVAAGVTDDRGCWSFPKPGPGLYRVVIESAGHRDVLRFTIPGAEDAAAPIAVESDARMNPNLGLIIGLTLILGGSLAFVLLRRRKRNPEPTS